MAKSFRHVNVEMSICDDIASLSGIHSFCKNSDHYFRFTGQLSISWNLTVFLRCYLIKNNQILQLLSSKQNPIALSPHSDIPKRLAWGWITKLRCLVGIYPMNGNLEKRHGMKMIAFFVFAICIVCCFVLSQT